MFKKIWGYRPVDYRTCPSLLLPQVQLLNIDIQIASNALEFHFSNKNGVSPLHLTNLTLMDFRDGVCAFESEILFSGKNEIELAIDDEIMSDAVYFSFEKSDCLQISVTVPKRTYLTSGVVTYSQLNMHVDNYDLATGTRISQIEQYQMVKNNPRMTCFYGLDSIYSEVDNNVKVISVFGDSITQQGFYVNHLRCSLNENNEIQFGVNNLGIGGNRILFDTDPMFDMWYRHGIAGIKRFETDIFPRNSEKPDIVFVFHGINDIIQETIHPGDSENIEEIIMGLRKYASILQRHHVLSLIGTLLPMGNSIFYSEEVEKKRSLLNEWIRHQKDFNSVVDLESVMLDSSDQKVLPQRYDSGDGLHPNDAAGQVIGEMIANKVINM